MGKSNKKGLGYKMGTRLAFAGLIVWSLFAIGFTIWLGSKGHWTNSNLSRNGEDGHIWALRLWALVTGALFFLHSTYCMYLGGYKRLVARFLCYAACVMLIISTFIPCKTGAGASDTDEFIANIHLLVSFSSTMVLLAGTAVFALWMRYSKKIRMVDDLVIMGIALAIALLSILIFKIVTSLVEVFTITAFSFLWVRFAWKLLRWEKAIESLPPKPGRPAAKDSKKTATKSEKTEKNDKKQDGKKESENPLDYEEGLW
ncbi:MAG: hypothetical protein J5757_08275 [Lachnospiraceae bacterium]|nr:hypothetical protein [Lachnospiraceae bacterium]